MNFDRAAIVPINKANARDGVTYLVRTINGWTTARISGRSAIMGTEWCICTPDGFPIYGDENDAPTYFNGMKVLAAFEIQETPPVVEG